jgi:hypothetical protein
MDVVDDSVVDGRERRIGATMPSFGTSFKTRSHSFETSFKTPVSSKPHFLLVTADEGQAERQAMLRLLGVKEGEEPARDPVASQAVMFFKQLQAPKVKRVSDLSASLK